MLVVAVDVTADVSFFAHFLSQGVHQKRTMVATYGLSTAIIIIQHDVPYSENFD